MALRPRPPQHRATAKAVLISRQDSAWDMDRLDEEVEKLEPDDRGGHPYVQYMQGETRFDLGAMVSWKNGRSSPRDYLEGEPDAQFVLRRLSVEQVAEIRDAAERERGRDESAWNAIMVRAARMGLGDIEGEGWSFALDGRGLASAETMQGIYDAGGISLVTEIGWAVYLYSQPLSEQEKKV